MDSIYCDHRFAGRLHHVVHPGDMEIHRVRCRLACYCDLHCCQHRNRYLYGGQRKAGLISPAYCRNIQLLARLMKTVGARDLDELVVHT